MSEETLSLDLYQLTTLLAHAAEGRLQQQVGMSFFFRRMPKNRNYVVTAGLDAIASCCMRMQIDGYSEMRAITHHPVLAPAFRTSAGAEVLAGLRAMHGFVGDADAVPEGTLTFAGPASDARGRPLEHRGRPVMAYTPLIQVRTSLLMAKLIETPWLCRLNHMSMVASKAARVVTAAAGRPVLEFGQRRTHHAAAVDAALAAYMAGCQGTSNLRATHYYGVPSFGTMDHFAVMAAEQVGVPLAESEGSFFARFCEMFPHAATLLVDTYDTARGIENAVRSTSGRLTGIRIDSNVTPETVRQARDLLRALGAPGVKIFVSDGLDEWRVRELAAAGADGFGVGENITCSPDAATGIGAVGKLAVNGYGKPVMKMSRGSGKATLPGMLQVYRFEDHDLICLADEPNPGGEPLLQPLWRGKGSAIGLLGPRNLEAARERVARQIAALPQALRDLEVSQVPRQLRMSDQLADLTIRSMETVDSEMGA